MSLISNRRCPVCSARSISVRHIQKSGKKNPIKCRNCGAHVYAIYGYLDFILYTIFAGGIFPGTFVIWAFVENLYIVILWVILMLLLMGSISRLWPLGHFSVQNLEIDR